MAMPSSLAFVTDLKSEKQSGMQCEFYNGTCATEAAKAGTSSKNCSGYQTCPDADSEHICYVVWSTGNVNDTTANDEGGHKSGHNVKMMGCIQSSVKCLKRDRCLEDDPEPSSGHYFCCCSGHRCNQHFEWVPRRISETTTLNPPVVKDKNPPLLSALYYIVPVIFFAVAFGAVCFVWRQRKEAQFNNLPTSADGEGGNSMVGPNGEIGGVLMAQLPKDTPIELLEIKARGRFGAVWKGKLGNDFVAVKIFPLQDKSSWMAEKEIYTLPQMDNHESILKFLGVDKRFENLQQEFWLATEYHERGSLCDFLKANLVSWDDLCRIAMAIAKGLTFLHEEVAANSRSGMKPAIAHRDFKSKNVLIKRDMTACIADFGLALIFEPGKSCGDTHGQVGTRRYMAPEVLEGAINFSRDAFLRIDMYACGLVLWELATRCTAGQLSPSSNNGNMATHSVNIPGAVTTEEYKLPFEVEANSPTLEQMQDLVVNRKLRPRLKESWRLHPGLSQLCDTIDECWDHDAEARLSASCVVERVRNMKSLTFANHLTATDRINALNSDSGVGSVADDADSSHDDPQVEQTEMTPLFIQPHQNNNGDLTTTTVAM